MAETISYELFIGKRRIFRVKGKNNPYLGLTIILEALQDRLSIDSQLIEQVGEFTIINEEFTNDFNFISEYKFLLSPIEHTLAEDGEVYTPHIYIEQAKVDKNLLQSGVQLGHVRGIMQYLADNGVEMKYLKDNYIYELPPTN